MPFMTFFRDRPLLTGALIIALMMVFFLLRVARTSWIRRIQPKALLTPNEAEFFYRLERALPNYLVFPQVAFAAIITDDGRLSGQRRWSIRTKFDRKIVDYVICERGGMKIVALIELDDRTHNSAADRQRDAITKAAGYRTFRFQSKQKPSLQEIASLFEHARAWREH